MAPPFALCRLPRSADNVSANSLMFFRMSALTEWRTRNAMDPEFDIQRLITNLPYAVDPREFLKNKTGTLILCKTGAGHDAFVILRDSRLLGVPDLFAALDIDGSGSLERAEMWLLQESMKIWLADGVAVAKKISELPRDERERVGVEQLDSFWRKEIKMDYQSFVAIAALEETENEDEAAFRKMHDYLNYLPIGRIEAMGTEFVIPHIGILVCGSRSPLLNFAWELFYMLLVTPGYCFICYRLALHVEAEENFGRRSGMVVAITAWAMALLDPVSYISSFLYISPFVGQLFVALLMLSLPEYQGLLARYEYRVGQVGESRAESDETLWSLAPWQNDSPLVRCPLCRRLSQKSQVIRKVHGDIRRDPCCVCLSTESEVCFGCGHLCVCSGCFDTLAEHRSRYSQPIDLEMEQTVFGNVSADDDDTLENQRGAERDVEA